VATKRTVYRSPEARAVSWLWSRSRRRSVAVVGATGYLTAALYYSFVWGLEGHGVKSWYTPGDIWLTFQVAIDVLHGHLGAVYAQYRFTTLPGIVVLLLPVAALTSGLHLSHDVVPSPIYTHPHAWVILGPYSWVISVVPLFASDALAERLGASRQQRMALCGVQVVALWQVVVHFGHPEDALAVGLVLYALLFALDGRWTGAGWLMGAALAVQPLVLAVVPVFLALAGVRRWGRLVVQAIVPPLAVVIGPLVANFHQTVSALTLQPNYPLADHQTPWTALAPRVHIGVYAVAAGPGRVVSLALAIGIGWWAVRWKDRPELIVWAASVALALRCFTESVMDPYYLWPAIAVALVASVLVSRERFGLGLSLAVVISVTSQLQLSWIAWWTLNLGLLSAILLCTHTYPADLRQRELELRSAGAWWRSAAPTGTGSRRAINERKRPQPAPARRR